MIKEPSANPRHSDARQAASRLFAADFTARFSSNQLTPLDKTENYRLSQYLNPMRVIGIKRQRRIGSADLSQATTCHLERANLSLRIFNRRFTRKTLGFSKKLENLRFSVAIFVAHYNFCRRRSAERRVGRRRR